jgi:hypothetical protein
MPVDEVYRRQVALLLKVVPLVALEPSFALKGGTAINLFLRDMPRLSVDLDLTYVPVKDRASSLKDIDEAMRRIAKRINGGGVPGAQVNASAPRGEKGITKLIVRADNSQIKIEVTPVLRGCVYESAVQQYRRASRRNSVSLKCRSSILPIYTPARSSPLLIASIRVICSTAGSARA